MFNNISYDVRGAAFRVHKNLGPGLIESVYERALAFELCKANYNIETQFPVPAIYEGEKLEQGFRMDILVNHLVVVEIKSVEVIAEIHYKQLLTYLKLSNKKLCLLINFNVISLNESIIRMVNGL